MIKDELLKRVDDIIADCIRNDYHFGSYAYKVAEGIWPLLEAAEKERDDVAQQLVQSEIGKREISEERDAVTGRLSDLADENTALRAKIEVTDEVVRELEKKLSTGMWRALREENEALQAKVEQMERQEPVAFALYSGWAFKAAYHKEHEACDQRDRRQLSADLGGSLEAYRVVPLYALPGAQGEEK